MHEDDGNDNEPNRKQDDPDGVPDVGASAGDRWLRFERKRDSEVNSCQRAFEDSDSESDT